MKYLILILIFVGCSSLPTQPEIEPEVIELDPPQVTIEALFGKEFCSLDETVPHTDIFSTRIVFDSTNFTVYEDIYKIYPDVEYMYTQRHVGTIYDTTNCDGFQVMHINIRRVNNDGTEIFGGYKDYAMYLYEDIIILVQVDQFKKYNNQGEVYYPWLPTTTGDTTYLAEI